jgi:hypothetical protein
MQKTITLAALWLLASCAMARPTSQQHAIVLPPSQARHALEQCSRESPQSDADGTWTIPLATIARLEEDLSKLTAVGSHHWGIAASSAWNPRDYFRQYAGITIRGKKYVYINAFHDLPIYIDGQDPTRWEREPELACDGGDSFWGALYDPETRQFSQLAFNGVA